MKEGNAIKVTSSQTKAIVKQNLGWVKVGQLGPVLDVLREESPSILVDVIGEGNFMKELKKLKLKIHTLEGHVKKFLQGNETLDLRIGLGGWDLKRLKSLWRISLKCFCFKKLHWGWVGNFWSS
jgi:hypothetical protein